MIRQGKKCIGGLVAVMLLTAAIAFQSFAATAKISFSDPSTKVGEEVKVTMKFTSTSGDLLGDTNVVLDYDATMLEYINETDNVDGGAGKIRVRSFPGVAEAVTELRFKALRAGSTSITIANWDGYDNNGQKLTMEKEGSSSITIEGLATSSSDATLQYLLISPGTLTPAFTPTTESYRVTVGLDTERLTVDAKANNERATVEREGGDTLQEGENTVVCKVVAEDGTTTKNYTIVVNKIAGGESAGSMEEGGQTAATEPEVLVELTALAQKLQILRRPDDVAVPEGLNESNITYGDAELIGRTPENSGGETPYCVFYGMNESGVQGFYRYDLQDKTIQRYFENVNNVDPEILESVEKYNNLVDEYNRLRKITIGSIVVLLLIVVILLVLLILARRRRSGRGISGYGEQERASLRSEDRQASVSERRQKPDREERYMRGEEEEDDLPSDLYQPEPAPERTEFRQSQVVRNRRQQPGRAEGLSDVSMDDGTRTGKEEGSEEADDFEIFDLDDEK